MPSLPDICGLACVLTVLIVTAIILLLGRARRGVSTSRRPQDQTRGFNVKVKDERE